MRALTPTYVTRLNGRMEAVVYDTERQARVATCHHQHRTSLAAMSCAIRMARRELARRRRLEREERS